MDKENTMLAVQNLGSSFKILCEQVQQLYEAYGIYVLGYETWPTWGGPAIFMSHQGWLKLQREILNNVDYVTEPHSDKDRDPKTPITNRTYKLTLHHDGIAYYCLMSTPELVEEGLVSAEVLKDA